MAQQLAIGAACAVTVALVASAIAAFPAAGDSALTTGEGPLTPAGITYSVIFLIFLLAQLAAYFVTCAWLHLVRRNAEVLNPTHRHRHSVGWVWTSWLVPVVSLWFPYQVVADVRGATSPSSRSGVWLLRQWWAAWLLVWITTNITSTVFDLAGASYETWASWDAPLQVLAALFSVAALVAWIRIVREISNTQARSAAAQGWSPALAFGGPATGAVLAATGSSDPGGPGPDDGTSPLPADTTRTDTPDWAVPGAPPTSQPAPYPERPSPYAGPPAPSPPYSGWPGPGGPGGPGVWWGRPASAAMGVWALVLAVLPLCVTWLVAIGLAVAVLLRPDDGWRRGRGLAIAALAISSVWILLVSGLFITGMTVPEPEADSAARSKNDSPKPDPEKAPSGDALKVGDCIPKVPKAVDYTVNVKVAPCSAPHRAEVYAVWDLGGGPYPSVDRLIDLADDGCWERFGPFIGHGYDSSNLEFTYLTPDEEDWLNNSRMVTCVVYDNAPFTGTLRGSRR